LDAWNTGLNKSSFKGGKVMNKKICLGITAIAAATALFVASSCTTPANHQPIIASLEAEAEQVVALGNLQVTCTASDPDGDQLSYNWSASAGEVNGDGDAAMWTAPASEGSYSVAVVVTDGHGGEVKGYVTIAVRANNPPIIASLTAGAEWTTPSGSIQVTCSASDPDGDELSYNWTATAGNISGTGTLVNWIAPQAVGTYNITVVVRDGYGGEATRSLSCSVTLGTPPTIEKLCVTPKGHIYLRECTVAGCDYDVWKIREYNIECLASGTGELVYDWSCTAGNISGAGSNITWTAPNEISVDNETSVDVTVTVIVSDTAGNSVPENMVFHVPSCTCGSWGLKLGCK
jgi:hypothetical protein